MAAARAGFRRIFSISAISPPPLATAAPASESEFRRLFSISAFSSPLPVAAHPAAEPSTNLFVSGKTPCHFISPFLPLLFILVLELDTRSGRVSSCSCPLLRRSVFLVVIHDLLLD
ncbi:hypothetical protein C4D60_Mb11t16450 [Musa balbisiana]|uniref:Uncharacterized protein n=1 Tax=Musa balbisiana TaxID=52838 RepID=A0A4S8J5I1_MUSBA|nr:hypothetical protein C4D60_Mb11t16450 [Musa balbisiana]